MKTLQSLASLPESLWACAIFCPLRLSQANIISHPRPKKDELPSMTFPSQDMSIPNFRTENPNQTKIRAENPNQTKIRTNPNPNHPENPTRLLQARRGCYGESVFWFGFSDWLSRVGFLVQFSDAGFVCFGVALIGLSDLNSDLPTTNRSTRPIGNTDFETKILSAI